MNVFSSSALALVFTLSAYAPTHAAVRPGVSPNARPPATTLQVLPADTPAADTSGPHTTFRLTDLRRLVRVGSPEISPDGKHIAMVVSRPDWKNDKSHRELDLVDVATGARRPLTYRRDGVSSPKWSPSGDRLAFLARDTATKKSQIWVLHMNGGDAIRLTDSKTGVSAYSWSPDGRAIAYVAQDTVPNPKAIKHHEDAFQITLNNYQVRAAVQPWHLWMIPAEPADSAAAKRLTAGSWGLECGWEVRRCRAPSGRVVRGCVPFHPRARRHIGGGRLAAFAPRGHPRHGGHPDRNDRRHASRR
jgi:hypothetical protein